MKQMIRDEEALAFLNIASFVLCAVGVAMILIGISREQMHSFDLLGSAIVTLGSASMIPVTLYRPCRWRCPLRRRSRLPVTIAVVLTAVGVANFIFALVAG